MFAQSVVGPFVCLSLLTADPAAPDAPDRTPAPLGQHAALIRIDRQVRPVAPGTAGQAAPQIDWTALRRTQAALVKSHYVVSRALQSPEIASLPTVVAHPDGPAEWLQEHLVVDFPEDGELMRVALNEGAHEDRAKIVNAIVDVYFAEVVSQEQVQREEDIAVLQRHYEKTGNDWAKKSQRFHDLSKRLGLRPARQQQLAKQLNALVEYRSEVEIRQLRLELRQSLVENGVPSGIIEQSTDEGVARSTSVADLAKEREVLQAHLAKLNALIASRTDEMEGDSTDLAAQRREIAGLEERLGQLAARIQELRSEGEGQRDRITLMRRAE